MHRYKICSVFGPEKMQISQNLRDRLFCIFGSIMQNGADIFIFGGWGDFVQACLETVCLLSEKDVALPKPVCLVAYDRTEDDCLRNGIKIISGSDTAVIFAEVDAEGVLKVILETAKERKIPVFNLIA